MSQRWVCSGLAVTLLATVACDRWRPLPEEVHLTPAFAGPGSAYGETLERYTRKVELYEGLDTVARGWATWRSPELRQALAEASIRAYELDNGAAELLRKEEARAARGLREFHLALYTPKDDWNDLESEDTLWTSFLLLPNGERLQPVRVIHLPKTDKSAVQYPYVNRWTREYSLFFPLLERDEVYEHLTLVITGPLGTVRFAF